MSLKLNILLALLAVTIAGCQRQEPASAGSAAEHAPVEKKEPLPASKMTQDSFRKGMAVEDVKDIQYVGESGERLSFADFIATVQAGHSFKKEVEADKSLAVMTINKKGNEAPETVDATGSAQPLNFPVSAELPPIKNKDLYNHLNVLANGKRYTLVSFFFADCVPCIQEIPALNSLAIGRVNLQIVSVTFESKEIASHFAKQRGLKTSIVPESQDYIDALGVQVYPTLILVSPEGRLMGVRSSYKVTNSKDAGLADLKSWMSSFGLKT